MKRKYWFFLTALFRLIVPVNFLSVLLMVFSVSGLLYGQNTNSPNPAENRYARTSAKKSNFSYTITGNEKNGFGYDVYEGGRMLIHQPGVPGLPGNKGFATKNDAEKVAKLVIKKLSNNIMPPSVSRQELENLKIKI